MAKFECVGCGRLNEVAVAAKELGTSRVGARICAAIWKDGTPRMTGKEVALLMRRSESTTACQWARRWLAKLEQEGLVDRALVSDGGRGRSDVWFLTAAGIEVAEQCL